MLWPVSQVFWTAEPNPLAAWGMSVRSGRPERVRLERFADLKDRSRLLGRIWESSWGLRIALGFVVVLVWTGATSLSSSSVPATGPASSPSVNSPAIEQTSPAALPAPAAGAAAGNLNLPQQTLDITYDYGPGPQPVPGTSSTSAP